MALGSPVKWQPKKTTNFSNKDIKSAKYLEDFYWAFKQQNQKRLSYNYSLFKKHNSPQLKQYLPLLKDGINLVASFKKTGPLPKCNFKKSKDPIIQQYHYLYRRHCLSENASKVLSKKKLDRPSKEFLKSNFNYFLQKRNQNKLLKALKVWDKASKQVFSESLTANIYKTKELPAQELLEFLSIDNKLTKFIQENHLFEKGSLKNYSKEFTSMVTSFKHFYLRGENEIAKEHLLDAIDFYEANQEKINNSKAWQLFITSGKKVARRDDFSLALDLFRLSEKSGDEEQAFESKFQVLFALYRERKLSEARKFIREEGFVESFDTLNSKLRFWVSRVFEESKEYKKAKTLFKKQIELNPLSFYSILSLKKLQSLSPSQELSLLIDEDYPDLNITPSEATYHLSNLFQLFQQSRAELLKNTMARALRRLPAKTFFKDIEASKAQAMKPYFLIKFFSFHDSHLHSFKVAYSNLNQGKIKLNRLVIESLFPRKYQSFVMEHAPNIENKVILSLIRQESAFNERARSAVGARGLMQIMPATGRQFKRNLKAYQLYKPELNIKIGTRFLNELLRKYDGDLIFTLSAYNAGMGNVSRWKKSIPFTGDELTNVELIPFKETRNYVKLIYRNLFFYSALEGKGKELLSPVRNSFKVALKD